MIVAVSANRVSPPNVATASAPGVAPVKDYTQPVTATFLLSGGPAVVDSVSLTLSSTSSSSLLEAYDVLGNLIATASGGALATLTVSVTGSIHRLILHQGPLAFDDFTFTNLAPACTSFTVYGTGCPGLGGFVPVLFTATCPAAATSIQLEITRGLGGAPALLLAGTSSASLPLGGSCQLLVSPVLLTVGLPLTGSGAGAGDTILLSTVPPTASGLQIFLQAAVMDAAAVPGWSTSNGLRLDF